MALSAGSSFGYWLPGCESLVPRCQNANILSTYFRDSQGNYIFDHLNNLSQISKFGSPMLFVSGSRSLVKKIEALFRGFQIWATMSAKNPGANG
jgi:hypothetical protein